MRKQCTMLVAVFLFALAAHATNDDSLKAQMVRDWQRAKVYTKAYLDAMPADKYSYRPTDSVRTFAEQMLHLASGNVGLVSNGTGQQRIPIGREKSPTAQSKDSVVHYVMVSYDFAISGLQNMNVTQFEEAVKRGNLSESRLAWIQKAFEHQTHHRGQCTIYIRMVGVKPPNEMLF